MPKCLVGNFACTQVSIFVLQHPQKLSQVAFSITCSTAFAVVWNVEMEDDHGVLKLWRDLNLEGSFTGVKTFQTLLRLNKNIDISERKLYQNLKNDPLFVMHQRGKKS